VREHGARKARSVTRGGRGCAEDETGRKKENTLAHRRTTPSTPPPSLTPIPLSLVSLSRLRYLTLAAAGVVLGVGLNARPDSSIATWAKGEAQKELGE
jgi:hypothetical protein